MSYTVFARKYRPQTFDEVVGQDHIVKTLKNAIEHDRLAQAYLFVGPRGTGKTSTARIFAKALNCVNGPTTTPCGECDACKEIEKGNSMNVLEFDAASNTQVDKIREIIIDTVKYVPTRGKYKLYIVDEVHMLSTSSFNALLKTLEEPPPHVKFVFATTDVQKVPTTIISRCQRFDLRRISTPEITQHLLFIAGKENVALSPDAAEAVARGAEGGMRDAESMLDQLVSFCGNTIEEADVLSVFGFTSAHTTTALVDQLIAREPAAALAIVHGEAEAGKDLSRLMSDLIAHLRNLLVIQCAPGGLSDELSTEAIAALTEQGQRIAQDRVLELIQQFADAESRMKWAPNKKMHFEVAVIRAIQALGQATLDEVIDTLAALRGGEPLPAKPAAPPASAKPAPAPARPAAPASSSARPSLSAAVAAELETKNAPTVPTPPPTAPAPTAIVAEEPARPAPAPVAGPSAEELWPQFVARVRKERPLIQGWVEAGQIVAVEGDTAIFAFPTDESLALESCERANNRKYLEQLASELAGRPLAFHFEKRAGLAPQKVEIVEAKAEPAADPMTAFKADPLIQKALDEFKAEIIPA